MEQLITLCALLFIAGHSNRHIGAVGATTINLAEICPYTDFCKQKANGTIVDKDLQPCCLPCSCSPDCAIVGKCCPDAQQTSNPTYVYPCRTQSDIYSSYLKKIIKQKGNFYRIIDGCPSGSLHKPELAGSVFGCYNATSIEDLVFVTGSISGNTYLNAHCAMCNNEFVYTAWGLYLVDTDVFSSVYSLEQTTQLILNQGGVLSVPPTQAIGLSAFCKESRFNACNVTKKWDYYDEELEINCNKHSQGNWLGNRKFTSAYCYLCNFPKGTPLPVQCESIVFGPKSHGQTLVPQFTALLRLTTPKTKPLTKCESGQIMDPFRGVCTKLFCPTGSYTQNGVCIYLAEHEVNYQMRLLFEVLFENGTDTTSIDYRVFISDIMTLIASHLDEGCEMCDCYVESVKDTGVTFVSSTLFSSQYCSVRDLTKGLSSLFPSRSVNVYLSKSKLALTLVNRRSRSEIESAIKAKSLAFEHFRFCRKYQMFSYNESIYCPSIEINLADIHNLTLGGDVTNQIHVLSKSVFVGNGTSRVCVEDYLHILKSAQLISSAKRNSPFPFLSLIGSMFHIIYITDLY